MTPRADKVAVVAEVKSRFEEAEAVILTEYRGLDVNAMAELRRALRQAGGDYKVYKNTMVRFAAGELDLEIEELLVGPTAIAFTGTRPDGSAGDAATVTKALTEFGVDNENLIIKGGLLDGEPLTLDQIKALSKLPSREALLTKLAGGMVAPLQQLAALFNAVTVKFAFALQALIEVGDAPENSQSVTTGEAVADNEDLAGEVATEKSAGSSGEGSLEDPDTEDVDEIPVAESSDDQEPAQSGEEKES